jgi:hypothetical protein
MLKLSTVFSVIAILSISMVISGCAGPSANQQVQANVITKTSGETVGNVTPTHITYILLC